MCSPYASLKGPYSGSSPSGYLAMIPLHASLMISSISIRFEVSLPSSAVPEEAPLQQRPFSQLKNCPGFRLKLSFTLCACLASEAFQAARRWLSYTRPTSSTSSHASSTLGAGFLTALANALCRLQVRSSLDTFAQQLIRETGVAQGPPFLLWCAPSSSAYARTLFRSLRNLLSVSESAPAACGLASAATTNTFGDLLFFSPFVFFFLLAVEPLIGGLFCKEEKEGGGRRGKRAKKEKKESDCPSRQAVSLAQALTSFWERASLLKGEATGSLPKKKRKNSNILEGQHKKEV
eukprot:TRINITY_DN10348_c1_g1_i1.p1 TRINITY_DN10348_c1_g1~~TRINITY_DN10348_c1_g1_i1.p1  ORF type:complete len:292 (-),score=4.30 TRINITY_DN10348_c1_g1_i1:155-1030(-)